MIAAEIHALRLRSAAPVGGSAADRTQRTCDEAWRAAAPALGMRDGRVLPIGSTYAAGHFRAPVFSRCVRKCLIFVSRVVKKARIMLVFFRLK
jgi:cystathionine beta-lyase family protein involved in aluminum resistance